MGATMKKSGTYNTAPPAFDPLDDPPIRHTPEETRIDRPRRQLVDLSTFVGPEKAVKLDILPPHHTMMEVDHPARQGVIVHTSALDRAKGFQWIITPLSVVLAVLAVLVSIVFDNEFFSFASLLIFWLTFCVIYVIGWGLTAIATPEAVSFYSAVRQWNVIEKEQTERWDHYRWQTQRDAPVRPWWIEYKTWIITGVMVWLSLWTLMIFSLVWR